MAQLVPLAFNLIQGVGAFAGAHPIAASAATGALTGGAQGGWEGALKGAALGGLGAGAGGLLGNALSRVGAPVAGATPLVGEVATPIAGGLGKGLGNFADEIVVTASPGAGLVGQGAAQVGGAVGSLAGDAKAPTTSQTPDAGSPPKTDGNSWGRQLGNTLGRNAVAQAFAQMPNSAAAPSATSIGNANPFSGGSGAGAPAGLAIKGSTAPDVYPWKRAA